MYLVSEESGKNQLYKNRSRAVRMCGLGGFHLAYCEVSGMWFMYELLVSGSIVINGDLVNTARGIVESHSSGNGENLCRL